MAFYPTHDENVRQPMDWKRRNEEDTVLSADEANERFIHEGHTTIVVKPTYGLVRERGYNDQPVD